MSTPMRHGGRRGCSLSRSIHWCGRSLCVSLSLSLSLCRSIQIVCSPPSGCLTARLVPAAGLFLVAGIGSSISLAGAAVTRDEARAPEEGDFFLDDMAEEGGAIEREVESSNCGGARRS